MNVANLRRWVESAQKNLDEIDSRLARVASMPGEMRVAVGEVVLTIEDLLASNSAMAELLEKHWKQKADGWRAWMLDKEKYKLMKEIWDDEQKLDGV